MFRPVAADPGKGFSFLRKLVGESMMAIIGQRGIPFGLV